MKEKMPSKFNVLAIYNAEVYRGIVHTEEWTIKMMELQLEYSKWIRLETGRFPYEDAGRKG